MSPRPSPGFTLLELIVVIAIIAVLSTMATFGYGKIQASARDAGRMQIISGVRTALERYRSQNGIYPRVGSDVGTYYPNCSNFTNWAQGGFGGLLNLLIGTGYLTRPITDPSSGGKEITTYPGCGYAAGCTTPGGDSCHWGDLGKGAQLGDKTVCGWDHCGLFGDNPWPAGYHYYSDGNTYTMILVKESGGTATFTSPN